MRIAKRYSHKAGEALLYRDKSHLIEEIEAAIHDISALDCLTKISQEASRLSKWGGLLFSPRTINAYFKAKLLIPYGWLVWNEKSQQYHEPTLRFAAESGIKGSDRYRKLDGIKDRVGLEVQLGKYAFMGYDVFSKMLIFRNQGLIDYGIEIVLTQEMIDCMSTGVSAFEHLMIDFKYRGEADIDIPVLVLGIEPTKEEWEEVFALQALFKKDPALAQQQYPNIGTSDLKGTKPGPK